VCSREKERVRGKSETMRFVLLLLVTIAAIAACESSGNADVSPYVKKSTHRAKREGSWFVLTLFLSHENHAHALITTPIPF
jgi:hypothetical protein